MMRDNETKSGNAAGQLCKRLGMFDYRFIVVSIVAIKLLERLKVLKGEWVVTYARPDLTSVPTLLPGLEVVG